MTQKERIEMLAKLCWDYMTDLNKVNEEGYEIARKIDANEPGVSITQLQLNDREMRRIRNKFVKPTVGLLHSEGVKLMKMEDGKLKLLMEDGREMAIDVNESESSIERLF
jgi:hypothetical protein